MNCVNLIGNLTKDPEIFYTSGNEPTAVCAFTIAINRLKDGADFPRVVCFGKTAENCDRYLEKGRKVGVTGRLQTSSYDKDGKKYYKTEVIADRVEFLNGVQMEERRELPDSFEQAKVKAPF